MFSKTRKECVLCSTHLIEKYTQKKQPITYCPKITSPDNDVYMDLTYGACPNCGSVQLMTLVDPNILYEDSHNITYDTPTWKQHHAQFAEFVLANADKEIIEVGGSSGILAKNILCIRPETKYTILDLCNPIQRDPSIQYTIGNCEQHIFCPNTTVVMSHLFEHLYEPRRFIENLARNTVRKVFISIPNMKVLLANKSPAVIHTEHTYYMEDSDAAQLFKSYGYALQSQVDYKTHSHFMYFTLEDGLTKTNIWPTSTRAAQILETFRARDERFGNITVQPNSFIVPAGHYGQIMYCLMKDSAQNVAGFLDNDPAKQGKRVYGTLANVFPMTYIQKYSNSEPVHIYLHAGPYTAEIKSQLLSNCPHATIYEL